MCVAVEWTAKIFSDEILGQQKTALRRFFDFPSQLEDLITGMLGSEQRSHLGSQQRYRTNLLC